MLEEYNKCKNKLEENLCSISEGVKITSKIRWYEEGEKSSNFFLNLEKIKAVQGILCSHLVFSLFLNSMKKITVFEGIKYFLKLLN